MYNSYWGFRHSPFSGYVDPERFYESPGHEEALARLSYVATERRPGALLLGGPGVGKTLVLEVFARRMRRPNCEIALVRCPALGPRELFFELAQEFRLAPDRSATEADLWRMLRDHVIARRIEGHQSIIVVDQAHLLSETPAHLRALQLLYHLDTDPTSRLSIVLGARPELMRNARAEVLEWTDLGVTLEPLTAPQTAAYVNHLSGLAGRKDPAFSDGGLSKVHELTGGVPRQINRLCDWALLAGATDERTVVTETVIESVYKELTPEVSNPIPVAV